MNIYYDKKTLNWILNNLTPSAFYKDTVEGSEVILFRIIVIMATIVYSFLFLLFSPIIFLVPIKTKKKEKGK